ncbi:MAG TPA: amidohydrolase family protein [Gaiellaceae bacterium]
MEDVYERAASLVARYEDEVRGLVPAGAELFDAHVHLGTDIDGFVAPLDELVGFLRGWGMSGAFAFCLDEPDRHPAFSAANDRTLAGAETSGGLLVPFVRLDLSEDPIAEAERCLDKGARGIKLHPRAQGFLLTDDRLDPVFRLAAERRVPILIHGGRGLPPIADALGRLAEAHPEARLIIAHLGIADLAALCGAFSGRAGIFFDTSVWSPIDLLDAFSRIPPEQLVYASDYPYGQQPNSLANTIQAARRVGFSDDQLRDLLGRTAMRIRDGEPPVEPTKAPGHRTISQPMSFARIHHYLAMATPLLWLRQPDVVGVLGLALNACAEKDGHVEERERIAELISCAGELWKGLPEIESEDEQRRLGRLVAKLVQLADIETVAVRA